MFSDYINEISFLGPKYEIFHHTEDNDCFVYRLSEKKNNLFNASEIVHVPIPSNKDYNWVDHSFRLRKILAEYKVSLFSINLGWDKSENNPDRTGLSIFIQNSEHSPETWKKIFNEIEKCLEENGCPKSPEGSQGGLALKGGKGYLYYRNLYLQRRNQVDPSVFQTSFYNNCCLSDDVNNLPKSATPNITLPEQDTKNLAKKKVKNTSLEKMALFPLNKLSAKAEATNFSSKTLVMKNENIYKFISDILKVIEDSFFESASTFLDLACLLMKELSDIFDEGLDNCIELTQF